MSSNFSPLELADTGLKRHLTVIKGVFIQQWRIRKAYMAGLVVFIFVPLILVTIPIIVMRAIVTDPDIIAQNFFGGAEGSLNIFIILGVNLWMLILMLLWDFGTYLREEQYIGTLESILMSPATRYSILIGRALFSIVINVAVILVSSIIAIVIFESSMLFTIEFLHLLAVFFVVILGCIPMMGLSYFIGALVLKFKEVFSLINMLQWALGLIMGIYAPWTTLPWVLKTMSILFPATWSLTDARAIIAGSPPMLSLLSLELGLETLGLPLFWGQIIVLIFGLFWCIVGYLIFSKIETRIKKNEGLSQY